MSSRIPPSRFFAVVPATLTFALWVPPAPVSAQTDDSAPGGPVIEGGDICTIDCDADQDEDELTDFQETMLGTDPLDWDSDDDLLSDGNEVNTYATDPNLPDSDGDGLDDGAEVFKWDTSPTEADTDGDLLWDSDEIFGWPGSLAGGSDPMRADTDGGGRDDRAERQIGSNPRDGVDDSKVQEHVVRVGDTLNDIAAENQTTLDAMVKANPAISDPDRIHSGTVLTVPFLVGAGAPAGSHLIRPGDTLRSIAQGSGVTTTELLAANPDIDDPDMIRAGAAISIPPTTNEERARGFHTVIPGDTLKKIARKHQASLQDILASNPQLTSPDLIRPGMRVHLP